MFFFFAYNQDENNESIKQINQLLKEFEAQLKLLPLENTHFSIMASGRRLSESMTQFLLKKEGLYDSKELKTFYKVYQTLYEHNIIPKECYDFLQLIRSYGNEAVHRMNLSDRLVLSFLNALNNFIQWFDNYCFENYQIKFQIEKCCELIYSLTYDETKNKLKFIKTDKLNDLKSANELKIHGLEINQDIIKITNKIETLEKEKSAKEIYYHDDSSGEFVPQKPEFKTEDLLNEEIKRLNEELKIKEEEHQSQINELKLINKEILKELAENRKQNEKLIEMMLENNERGKRMESKIDDLHSKIDKLSNQINLLQSLTERQINNAQSTEEIERIIETFIGECIDNIMSYSQSFTSDKNYKIEKKRLIYSIGEDGWNKLCEKSQTFLITSKVMYNHLITMEDVIDYSGICVLVTKALEVEMHKRFFTDFLEYLNSNYSDDYSKYPTALLYKKREPLLSEKFTMGNIAFVMCFYESRYDKKDEKINNKSKLMEYCKDCIFSNKTEVQIEELLNNYASSIEEIREKYRNPAAHTNEIKRIDAEDCFNLVLDYDRLLKKMLDSFDN